MKTTKWFLKSLKGDRKWLLLKIWHVFRVASRFLKNVLMQQYKREKTQNKSKVKDSHISQSREGVKSKIMPRPPASRGHYQTNNLLYMVYITVKKKNVPWITIRVYTFTYYLFLRHQYFTTSEITVLNTVTSPFVNFKWNTFKNEPWFYLKMYNTNIWWVWLACLAFMEIFGNTFFIAGICLSVQMLVILEGNHSFV